ncbi:hypothetical protein D3Z50_13415 [Clostridiaceae bacterium]|nr:hypothetical protein [Clostridiaceae bacterium]
MFLRIAGVQRTEQSGIRGVKRLFDPNIIIYYFLKKANYFLERGFEAALHTQCHDAGVKRHRYRRLFE